MACYHPIKGFRGVDGTVRFSRSGAYRDLPLTIACGQCSGCRLERSRQWAVRASHEAQLHNITSFLTLTYNDEHLPANGSLDVTHWQKFAKRLRKKIGSFRFLHCGEYGDETFRPHYHALIYGYDWMKDRKLWSNSNGFPLYTSPSLNKTWGKGYCYIGSLTYESAGYVARYAMKKVTGPSAKAMYGWEEKGHDKETGEVFYDYAYKPPYITMSRRPGLGSGWYDKFKSDVYPDDEVIINGIRARPPAYYDTLLERDDPKLMQTLKSIRKAQGAKHDDNNTYDRLAVRERHQAAKTSRLQRKI